MEQKGKVIPLYSSLILEGWRQPPKVSFKNDPYLESNSGLRNVHAAGQCRLFNLHKGQFGCARDEPRHIMFFDLISPLLGIWGHNQRLTQRLMYKEVHHSLNSIRGKWQQFKCLHIIKKENGWHKLKFCRTLCSLKIMFSKNTWGQKKTIMQNIFREREN